MYLTKEEVQYVQLPEELIVDGIVGKVGQISKHLELILCS